MQKERFYRDWVKSDDLITFKLEIFETRLFISADKMIKKKAEDVVYKHRGDLLDYIDTNSSFKDSFEPIDMDESAPGIVKDMIEKSAIAGVGPMAGIAGAVAEYTGRALLNGHCSQIIIENGGDIFMKSGIERKLSIYAGKSPLSGKINLKISPHKTPLGLCASSGTVGHSKSFGAADAALVVSGDTILADCVATQAGNMVKNPDNFKTAIDYAKSIKGIRGVLLIMGDSLAAWGDIELV